MGRRALVAVAVGALLTGCGGSSSDEAPLPARATTPSLPFPPKAFEPGAGGRDASSDGRVVRLGGRPEGVAVIDGIAGIGVKGERDELVLLDVSSGRVLRRVAISSAPRHVQVGGGRFLVPGEESDQLDLVDPRTGEVTAAPAGDNPHDATYADGVAYTADEFGSTITASRGSSLVRRVPVDAQPGGIVAVGDALAVVSVRAYTVELFDRRTLRGGGSQNVGYGPSHVVAASDGRLFIADTRGDGLSVFATSPRLRFVARVPLAGSPYGLALDEERDRLWVTRTGRNEVTALSLGSRPRPLQTLKTVRQPNTVAVDAASGRLVVTSATDGTVQLLDP